MALRPPAPPLGVWPALNATVRGQIGRFNTPNVDNVRTLLSDVIGLPNIQLHWTWQNNTSAQAVARLGLAMDLRHQIAHGVNPRPVVSGCGKSFGSLRQRGRAEHPSRPARLRSVRELPVP